MVKNNFFDNIKTIDDFIERIKNNPNLLHILPEDKLDTLIRYYEKEVNRKLKLLNY